jgi:hypothetical protein
MDLKDLKASFYHRVAAGPHEPPTREVVGSDIVLHLPVLEYYASQCDHVTELGVREGCSTVALVAGCKGEVHSYDIEDSPITAVLGGMELPCRWQFHKGNTADPDLGIPETDFIFFDTLHTYVHLSKELDLWGRKARKYLGFHDTFTCGERDASGPNPNARGILPAVQEFLDAYPGEYETVYRTETCNGLWVLGRKPQ